MVATANIANKYRPSSKIKAKKNFTDRTLEILIPKGTRMIEEVIITLNIQIATTIFDVEHAKSMDTLCTISPSPT